MATPLPWAYREHRGTENTESAPDDELPELPDGPPAVADCSIPPATFGKRPRFTVRGEYRIETEARAPVRRVPDSPLALSREDLGKILAHERERAYEPRRPLSRWHAVELRQQSLDLFGIRIAVASRVQSGRPPRMSTTRPESSATVSIPEASNHADAFSSAFSAKVEPVSFGAG